MKMDRPLVRIPVPLQMQQQTGDCLVACASMVLHYIGRRAYHRQLIRALRPTKIGLPFSYITNVRALGAQVICRQGNLNELYTALNNHTPPIVAVQTVELPYWNKISTQHSVVVVGMSNDYIFLNDPMVPIPALRVSIGDFDLAWFEQGEQYALLKDQNLHKKE